MSRWITRHARNDCLANEVEDIRFVMDSMASLSSEDTTGIEQFNPRNLPFIARNSRQTLTIQRLDRQTNEEFGLQ